MNVLEEVDFTERWIAEHLGAKNLGFLIAKEIRYQRYKAERIERMALEQKSIKKQAQKNYKRISALLRKGTR